MSLFELSYINKTDKEAEKALALRTKQTINNTIQIFNTFPIELRLYCGFACFCLILIIITFFMNIFYISIIADVMSLIAALIGCIFVSNNAKRKIDTETNS